MIVPIPPMIIMNMTLKEVSIEYEVIPSDLRKTNAQRDPATPQ